MIAQNFAEAAKQGLSTCMSDFTLLALISDMSSLLKKLGQSPNYFVDKNIKLNDIGLIESFIGNLTTK